MTTYVYFLTRDTNCSGELSPAIDVWYRKPIRHKLTFDRGYVWLPSIAAGEDPKNVPRDLGFYGAYTVERARQNFGTIPDTDLEVIRCIQDRK